MKNWLINSVLGATFALFATNCFAQNLSSRQGHAAVGIGLGLPYGGIGARINLNPDNQITFFGGVGYNLAGIGFNGGLRFIIPTQRQVDVYILGMFGTNASIRIEGYSDATRSYYGPSVGAGIQLNSLGREGNYWDFGLVLPFRSDEYNRDIEQWRNHDITEPWPVLVTVGYNINIGKK